MANVPGWVFIMSALLTPALAFFGLYLGWHQWRINEQKLRLDLFEKRKYIFSAEKRLLLQIVSTGRTNHGQLKDFYDNATDAIFLFDEETEKRIKKIRNNAIKIISKDLEVFKPEGGSRFDESEDKESFRKSAAELDELKLWFASKLGDQMAFYEKRMTLNVPSLSSIIFSRVNLFITLMSNIYSWCLSKFR